MGAGRAVNVRDALRQIDGDAVFWAGFAYAAYVVGLVFVLAGWRAMGSPGDAVGFVVVNGVFSASVSAASVVLLVRERPSRGLLGVLGAWWTVIAAFGLALGAARLIAAPAAPLASVQVALYGLSFGLVDAESLAPLVVAWPKDLFALGVVVGYAVGRLACGPRRLQPAPPESWFGRERRAR